MPGDTENKKVLVAMSGGTDSSAVCLMLREQGYELAGLTMRVWDLPRQFADGASEPDFILAARALAADLGFPHFVADEREAFRREVVGYFLDEYAAGRTPNPCVRCNRDFKFRLLVQWADRLGCAHIATGHYVGTERRGNRVYLRMGADERKDQSYFLWRVPPETLARCLFPLGDMEKPAVRAYLEARGRHAAARKPESMETCFVEGDYRDFLREQCPGLSAGVAGGAFVSTDGRRLGTHQGVPFYTVGQRKGLGIALGRPAYVVRLNAEKNTVVLGEAADLLADAFFVEQGTCVDADAFFSSPQLGVRIRYHSHPEPCTVEPLPDGRWLVRTARPVSAVTPGQSAVFYAGRLVVGGGVIASQRGIGAFRKKNENS